MRSFGSDNHSGIHPAVLRAIEAANADHQIAYGDDIYTARAKQLIKLVIRRMGLTEREVMPSKASPSILLSG